MLLSYEYIGGDKENNTYFWAIFGELLSNLKVTDFHFEHSITVFQIIL